MVGKCWRTMTGRRGRGMDDRWVWATCLIQVRFAVTILQLRGRNGLVASNGSPEAFLRGLSNSTCISTKTQSNIT